MKNLVLCLFLLFGSIANASYFIPDGSITNKKLASKNIQQGATGNFNTTSATFVDVTGYTATLTLTSSRPVFVGLMDNGSPGAGNVNANNPSGATAGGVVGFAEGIAIISQNTIFTNHVGSTASNITLPCSSFWTIQIAVSPGTYTYKTIAQANGGTTINFNACRIIAYEM